MSMRTSRVEETLRRALADILLRGELRDPRLRNAAAISITAVKMSPDLGSAQVYVDVLDSPGASGTSAAPAIDEVLAGLNAGASALRARLGSRIRLKRTPSLRFVVDRSIEQGRRIEAVLAELHAGDRPAVEGQGAGEAEPAEPEPELDEADEADEADELDELDEADEPDADDRE
jgi:ribosome-binding factor A